jgi:uncharacterized protein YxjI
MKGDNIASSKAYLIAPKLGGLANNTVIQTETKELLYSLRTKILALTGRQYIVTDPSGKEVLKTEQDHTIIFPRHRLIRAGKQVGVMGQAGIIPQKYSVEINGLPRAEVHIGGLTPISKLKTKSTVLAEIAQHRSTWITVLHTESHADLLLMAIAILSRENTIGG